MPSADEHVVTARGLSKRYAAPGGDVVALDDVAIDVTAGSLTVVAGASGSGKSTLLMVVAAVDRPDDGEVTVAGVELTALGRRARRAWRRRHLGLVLGQPADNLTDRHDAIGNLRWAASLRGERAVGATLDRDGARRLLEDLELGHLAEAGRRELSGGEQQRLAFACAVVGSPAIVVADEPTASLDHDSAELVVTMARRLADAGVTLLVASHDERVIDAADTVVRLDHGRRVA